MGWTAVDSGGLIAPITVRFELDFGGLWWTVYRVHGVQKIRGSNPLGSTKFLDTISPFLHRVGTVKDGLTAYLRPHLTANLVADLDIRDG